MCDDFTRESIGGNVARSITADDVVEILDGALLVRGAPGFIRCDNGPAFNSAAIRDWCRFRDIETTYIAPGSPWQNPWAESFNSRARDELFAREILIQSARRASSTASGASSTITIRRTAPWAPWHHRLSPFRSGHRHRGTLVEGGPVSGVLSDMLTLAEFEV